MVVGTGDDPRRAARLGRIRTIDIGRACGGGGAGRSSAARAAHPRSRRIRSQLAYVIYTSGSTGRPKGRGGHPWRSGELHGVSVPGLVGLQPGAGTRGTGCCRVRLLTWRTRWCSDAWPPAGVLHVLGCGRVPWIRWRGAGYVAAHRDRVREGGALASGGAGVGGAAGTECCRGAIAGAGRGVGVGPRVGRGSWWPQSGPPGARCSTTTVRPRPRIGVATAALSPEALADGRGADRAARAEHPPVRAR